MELTIGNIEQYFNLLNNLGVFDFFLFVDFTEKELELFNSKDDLDIDKETFERLNIWVCINASYKTIISKYKDLGITINATQIKQFNSEIKNIYNDIDTISNQIDKIQKDISNSGNKDSKAMIQKLKNNKARFLRVIKSEDSNFLNRIVELGIIKSVLREKLDCDAGILNIKDAFLRYFKLLCMGALDNG